MELKGQIIITGIKKKTKAETIIRHKNIQLIKININFNINCM